MVGVTFFYSRALLYFYLCPKLAPLPPWIGLIKRKCRDITKLCNTDLAGSITPENEFTLKIDREKVYYFLYFCHIYVFVELCLIFIYNQCIFVLNK